MLSHIRQLVPIEYFQLISAEHLPCKDLAHTPCTSCVNVPEPSMLLRKRQKATCTMRVEFEYQACASLADTVTASIAVKLQPNL